MNNEMFLTGLMLYLSGVCAEKLLRSTDRGCLPNKLQKSSYVHFISMTVFGVAGIIMLMEVAK